ncbi:MAG: hypothetical protein HY332_20420 [Chloroflexi bacterium]|nr:hypothetical protein [Chloroflexota bacterium]
MQTTLTPRERVRRALLRQEPDRVPIHEHPWASTLTRWRAEGLPAHVPPADYFGFEIAALSANCTPRLPAQVVAEDADHITVRDEYGSLVRDYRDKATTPEMIEPAVRTRDDWERLKPRLRPDDTRVDWDAARKRYEHERAAGRFVVFSNGVGFNRLQRYMRTDELLMAIGTDSEWVRDMYDTIADLVMVMCDRMLQRGFAFDGVWLSCDLGYRNALFFSLRHYREQHHPMMCRLGAFLAERGLPWILHSCGRVYELLPALIESGVACLQPLEVKAGNDVIALKRQYGDQIAFMGGIDVRVMAGDDPHALEEEIATKLTAAKPGGGYLYHSDHSIPKNVSLAQFRRVLELVRYYGRYD